MAKFDKISTEEKRPLRVGIILMLAAVVLIVFIIKIDAVGAAVGAVAEALAPFLYGIALAYILNVFVNLFERFIFRPIDKRSKSKIWFKLRRPLAIVLSIVLIILLFVFALLFMIPEIINSIKSLAESAQKTVPEYVDTFTVWIDKFITDNNLRDTIDEFFSQFNWSSLISNATKFTTDFLATVFDATKNIVSAFSTILIASIFSIYMLFGKEKLLTGLKSVLFAYIPEKAAKKISGVSTVANGVFYQFIKGQMLEAVILGSLCYIGMSILSFDYALLISSIIAMSALVPILGAYIGAALGAFILLIANPIDALWFLIFIIILQQLEGNIIYPRVVGASIGLPTIWTMFAVFFWGTLFGIPGILLGTPVTAVIYKLFRSSTKQRLKNRGIQKADVTVTTSGLTAAPIKPPSTTDKPSSKE